MYDLVVIGSGPGGYVCAIRAAQNKMKVAVVEKYPSLGGTCLNVGCIPSKNLLHLSNCFYQAKKKFGQYGIEFNDLQLNWQKMQSMKEQVIGKNGKGIQFLLKKNNIVHYTGNAAFVDKNTIRIATSEEIIKSKNFVIATGSKPANLPNIAIDKKKIISSTEGLSFSELPNSMVIIGGGVIGCELGSIYAKLGVQITIVEFCREIIATMDNELGASLRVSLQKVGIDFALGYSVAQVSYQNEQVLVEAKNGQKQWLADYCLLAVGRKAYTKNLGLEKLGIQTDKKESIIVNKNLQTSQENIYAIGDVIGGIMLAHKAEEEGIFVADQLANQVGHLNYATIPSVVYTSPEVASVGYSEQDLEQQSIPYKKGNFAFQSLGRASASGETDGFVKVLASTTNDEILGIHIIGARASDLIAEAVVAMEYRATSEDLAMINHAHPTFSEALKEASMDALNQKPIHK